MRRSCDEIRKPTENLQGDKQSERTKTLKPDGANALENSEAFAYSPSASRA